MISINGKTKFPGLALLGALMGAFASGGLPDAFMMANSPRALRRTARSAGTRSFGSRGKRYPEQSERQALRMHRRAQGGPGLEFIDGKGWQPRSA